MSHRQKKHANRGITPGKRQPMPVPGRTADHPFCAYMGADGDICSETTNLEKILTIQGPPQMVLVACPRHREDVRRLAIAFVLRSQVTPQTMVLQYHGGIYQVQVKGLPGKTVC